jgi:uncharacterized lipoprotein YddW (UPF0748 family)
MARGQRGPRWRLRRWGSALLALLLTLALTAALPLSQPARSQAAAPALPRPSNRLGEEIRAVWFTANDMDVLRDRTRMQEAVRQLAALHFNTIYPVVWNSGFAYYPSAVSERLGLQDFQYRGLQGQDILAELISEAHRQGLLVVPWFEFGFMVPPGSVLTRRQPAWLSRRRDGSVTSISAAGEVSWLNPMHPQVQALLTELILEIATNYDSDGIQFDDHTSLPSDFGYDAFTAALYTRSTGREPPANAADGTWLKWRADRISAFMQQLATQLRQKRPDFLISLSPNYHDFAYKRQLQDWLTWVRQGSVDEVVVQLYRPDLASFEAELTRPEFAVSRQRVPTAVGIFTGQRTQPVPIERVVAQAEASRRRGLGAGFFYYETLWEEAQEPAALRKAALDALYRQPAPRRPVAAAAPRPSPAPTPPGTSVPSGMPAQRSPAPGAAVPERPAPAQGPRVGPAPPAPGKAAPTPVPSSGASTPPSVPAPPVSVPPSFSVPPPPPLLPGPSESPGGLDPSWGPFNGAPPEPAIPQ